MNARRNIILPLISALVLTFASCREGYHTVDGCAWATTYHIVYSGDEIPADSIKSVVTLVDGELSMFNASSTLSAVNRGETDTVGMHFRTVFDCAAYVSMLSEGRYDPTVAPVVDLWGFGRRDIDAAEPSEAEIRQALSRVGIRRCAINAYGRLVRKVPGTEFDFSSLAKGYGVDLVADMLERNGCRNYMIEIGGEVRARGLNPRGEAWHIQVDSPAGGNTHCRDTILLLGPDPIALATSGNYRRARIDSCGRAYGHTISPLTGRPVVTEVLSASVLAPSCMLADAMATACMTGTVAQADSIATAAGLSAYVIYSTPNGDMASCRVGR